MAGDGSFMRPSISPYTNPSVPLLPHPPHHHSLSSPAVASQQQPGLPVAPAPHSLLSHGKSVSSLSNSIALKQQLEMEVEVSGSAVV